MEIACLSAISRAVAAKSSFSRVRNFATRAVRSSPRSVASAGGMLDHPLPQTFGASIFVDFKREFRLEEPRRQALDQLPKAQACDIPLRRRSVETTRQYDRVQLPTVPHG